MESRKTWLEISEQRLRHNYRVLAAAASAGGRETTILAVIKANAYGHGATLCAQVLAAEGAPWLGVTDAEEGAQVRRSLALNLPSRMAQPRILVMTGLLPSDADQIVESKLTPVLWTEVQLTALAQAARADFARGDGPFPIHLEIDTGMSRQGAPPGAPLDLFLDRLLAHPELHLEGVLTHFASAEIASATITDHQRTRFEAALHQIAARGLAPEWIHAGNSSTVDEASCMPWLQEIANRYGARSLARPGLALYGYALPIQGGPNLLRHDLKPVLTWKCRILAFLEIPAGATIGYNATFTTRRPMRLALLPVGYADGLRRELSATNSRSGGWVTLRGKSVAIVGRISMNLTTVDVTAIEDATLEDEITLLGDGITADDHALLAGAVPYEILCGLRSHPKLTHSAFAPPHDRPIPSGQN